MLLRALAAVAEVALFVLVGEGLAATVGTRKFAHVEDVSDLSRYLHLLEFCLAQRADRVASQPLIQAGTTDETFAIGTGGEVFQHVCADRADELLEHFFELWFRTIDA